jgi:pimeloyl-ACP methyl ester carboxylesterase
MTDQEVALTPQRPAWFERALADRGETARVMVDGVSISYRVWGQRGKPGIALVHGSNAHLEWWRFVAPFLADQFRVVAIDLSGNGDSGWRDRYTGRNFADEVWAVCQAAELGARPFVVGHSFGGFVVLETGHHYGDRLGGIILADFTVSPPEAYTEWGGRAEREGKTRRTTRVYAEMETALGRFRLIPEQPCQHPYVVDYIARQSLREVEGGWTWKFDPALFDHLEMGADQCDKFVELKCRSALILGEHSEDSGAQSADYMASITAGILPIVTIPETFHHMMFDEPLATAMTIKSFVLAWIRDDRRIEMAEALARLS